MKAGFSLWIVVRPSSDTVKSCAYDNIKNRRSVLLLRIRGAGQARRSKSYSTYKNEEESAVAKGSMVTQTNTIIRVKKPGPISCDCERCRHSKCRGDTVYCSYYDIFSPDKKTCSRYWCVKPVPKSRKQSARRSKKAT